MFAKMTDKWLRLLIPCLLFVLSLLVVKQSLSSLYWTFTSIYKNKAKTIQNNEKQAKQARIAQNYKFAKKNYPFSLHKRQVSSVTTCSVVCTVLTHFSADKELTDSSVHAYRHPPIISRRTLSKSTHINISSLSCKVNRTRCKNATSGKVLFVYQRNNS